MPHRDASVWMYAALIFGTRPATALLELEELGRVFDRAALAALFDRNPDTVSRWRRQRSIPHTLEPTVDRFWWFMHVACAERGWPADAARYFLLSIEPELGRPPAELVRTSDQQARSVAQVLAGKPTPMPGRAQPSGAPNEPMSVSQSAFAQLLTDEPDGDDAFAREYQAPSLAGRTRPIGADQDYLDRFRVRYTTNSSHAIPLGGQP